MPNDHKNETEKVNTHSINPRARRHARQYALQALYQWHIAQADLIEIESQFLRHQIRKETDLPYFKELIYGVPKHLDELEQTIQLFLTRPYSDIDPIELNVLHIAVYELIKRIDVPYKVIINEALELNKQFGSTEGFKFINGLLDKIAKKYRPNEISHK